MMETLPPLVAFLVTFFTTRFWIDVARERGLVGRDMNKHGEVLVAEAGGFSFVVGTFAGLSIYAILNAPSPELFAVISALTITGFIGFADDVLGWKKGLPQWLKPLLTLLSSLPLIAVTLYNPSYNSFFVFGVPVWVYSLLIVPIGVVGASNALNMLAGYNGLEAGLSIILISTLGVKAFLAGDLFTAQLALIAVSSLLAFLWFNKYPARVFPGDTLPYSAGVYLASLAIFGNLEIFAVAVFPLFFLEFILKARSRFKAENFGVPQPDGTLRPRYDKIYSVTHIFLRIPHITERKLVSYILLTQLVISALALLLL